ncbi:MAG TPA: GDSL-type esterase/lipase family protein [Polyangiaceae bacterium]|nr:GDSL-type esterase/lipase family protein [Polyangiaceae bacterium]
MKANVLRGFCPEPSQRVMYLRRVVRSAAYVSLLALVLGCSSNDTPSASGAGAAGSGGAGGSHTGGAAQTSGGQGNSGGPSAGGQTAPGGGFGTGGLTQGTSGPSGGSSSVSNGGTPPQAGASPVSGGSASSSGGLSGSGGAMSSGGNGAAGGSNGGSAGGMAAGGATAGGNSNANASVIAAGVRWVGRVDVSDPSTPKFAWSGVGFVATVAGTEIAVKLKSEGGGSDPVFFQPVIDGTPKPRLSVTGSDGVKTVVLGTALAAGDHLVELYRETEGKANFASSAFLGFASGVPKEPPPYSGRLIEIIGDSISAGYGNLGSEQHPNAGADPSGGCHFTTETESAYMTYGAVAARALRADASILAASGWGIYSDNGGNTNNVLPKIWGNALGERATPAWSFSQRPQAVVINLGTNDFSANMALGKDPFTTAYRALLKDVRAKYPEAWVYCAIGPMLYGDGLKNATSYITALVQDLNAQGDAKVKLLNFGQQDASKGTGCDWHPNVAEDQRMADMLKRELSSALGW